MEQGRADYSAHRYSEAENKWHALLLFRRGRTDAALTELKQLAARRPDDETTGLRLAASMISTNQSKEALAVLRNPDDKNGRTVGDILMRGLIALNQSDAKKATERLSQAMAFDSASGERHLFPAGLGESLRLEATLLPARLALVRRHLAEQDVASALGVLYAYPRNQCQSYAILLQRSWLILAKGDWVQAEVQLAGLAAMERSPDIAVQQAALQAGMLKPTNEQTTTAKLLRISQSGLESTGLAKLLGARSASAEQVRAVAINLGSQPSWESYIRELLELPRGLMRSTLDPEGLLTLRTFGPWEPMIDAS